MSVLLLRLAGPLQSWGDSSRFARRSTRSEPTKSGVVGLIAAAKGIRRCDDLEDLLDLRLGVRIDQPGRLLRDFHTAHHQVTGAAFPLSQRYYLSDAAFTVAIEAHLSLLEGIHEALRSPEFPLYLGRRACPPTMPLSRGIVDGSIMDALASAPWMASEHHRKTVADSDVRLEVRRDVDQQHPGNDADKPRESVRDVPISFDIEHRDYGWRDVVHDAVTIPNPSYNPDETHGTQDDEPDFFAAIGGR
jgi:CRISPR system Cascade subunit CasD